MGDIRKNFVSEIKTVKCHILHFGREMHKTKQNDFNLCKSRLVPFLDYGNAVDIFFRPR